MRLCEYISKQLLGERGLRFTQPQVVQDADAAVAAAVVVGGSVVVKAQLPFGGRGRLGAVRFADTPDEARAAAVQLLNATYRGVRVTQVSIEPRIAFQGEYYAGVTWGTREKMPAAILSNTGGVDVENAPAQCICRRTFDPVIGLSPYEGR